MNSTVIKQIIGILEDSNKYNYLLIFEDLEREYLFNINNPKEVDQTTLTVKDKKTGHETLMVVNEDFQIDCSKFKPKKFLKIKTDYYGKIIEKSEVVIMSYLDLFIKVFRLMNAQAVFILNTPIKSMVCYFIAGRVFHVEESEEIYELHEDNIYRLASIYGPSNISVISPLIKHYSCGDFYTEQNQLAIAKHKTFKNLRNGVSLC